MIHRPKALLLEDEALIAIELETLLTEMGIEPLYASTVETALALAEEHELAIALLDYRVGSSDASPVGKVLHEKGVPFAVCSGSELDEGHAVFKDVPCVSKPYLDKAVRDTVQCLLRGVPREAEGVTT